MNLKIIRIFFFCWALVFLFFNTSEVSAKKALGEICGTDGDCASDDCEDSDLTVYDNDFCVCKTAQHCAEAYDGEASEWDCLNDLDEKTHQLHFCKKKGSPGELGEDPIKPSQASAMAILTDPEEYVQAFQSEIAQILQKPQPKINIPGLNFSDINVEEMVTTDSDGTTWLNIPFLGEYLSAVYKYAMVIMGLIAVIGLITGGIQWTMSGSTSEGKQAAQKRIMGSVIGVVIISTSYVLLYTINPELVQFRNLKVQYVQGIPIPTHILDGEYDGSSFFYGTDLYDPTVNLPTTVTHLGQCSPGIKDIPYGCGGKTLCTSGCGLVSMAMVLNKPPAELAQLMVSEGWRGNEKKGATCNGTSWTGMKSIVEGKYGLKAELLYKIEKANDILIQGKPLIVHVQNSKRKDPSFTSLSKTEQQKQSTCKFTRAGHYIVLTGYDPEKQIYTVADPGVSNPPPERTQATVDHLKNGCSVAGFLYIHT